MLSNSPEPKFLNNFPTNLCANFDDVYCETWELLGVSEGLYTEAMGRFLDVWPTIEDKAKEFGDVMIDMCKSTRGESITRTSEELNKAHQRLSQELESLTLPIFEFFVSEGADEGRLLG